jgi:competence protein ComGC
MKTVIDSEAAFTRWELVALMAALFLLSLVAVPGLANTKPRGDRVTCINNLRMIGRAEHLWANDHRDQMPWRVDISEGGTQHNPLQNNSFVNYGVMSNELVTPIILACPSDDTAKPARTFSSSPADGFFNPNYRNRAISYFIGLDSFLTEPETASQSAFVAALAGDRNLQVDAINVICSSGVTAAAGVYPYIRLNNTTPHTKWTNAIHGIFGNILMIDGQVAQTSGIRAVDAIAPPIDDNGSYHVLMPR